MSMRRFQKYKHQYYLIGATCDGCEIIETISGNPDRKVLTLLDLISATDADNPTAYFEPLDNPVEGHLATNDGKSVKMRFVSEEDYLECAVGWGLGYAACEAL